MTSTATRLWTAARANAVMVTSSEGFGMLTFDHFYEAGFESVLRTAFVVVHDRAVAEEITQEAFAKAFASWGGYPDTTSLLHGYARSLFAW